MKTDCMVFEPWRLTGQFALQRAPERADDLAASISLYVEKQRKIVHGSYEKEETQWFHATISDIVELGIDPDLERYAHLQNSNPVRS